MQPRQKTKHKRLTLFLLVLLTIAHPALLFAELAQFTNDEWISMPRSQKIAFIGMAMDRMKDDDIPVRKTPVEYMEDVSSLYAKQSPKTLSVFSALPSVIYATEPEAKKIMDTLIKKKKIGPVISIPS